MITFLGLTFHLYGLLIGLGIWAAVEASEWLAKKRQIDLKIVNRLVWWTVIPGIIGARIYHVVDYWERYYSIQPIKALYLWEGGLAIWGAILGGLLGLAAYVNFQFSRNKVQLNFYDLLDIAFIGLPLAQAIGRWGNYFNGELLGKNGEPLFLYESVLDLLLFGVLILIAKSTLRSHPARRGERPFDKPGQIAGAYLIGYGLIRFILEPMRAEGMIWQIAGVPMAQIFSVAAIVIGIALITKNRTRPQPKP